MSSDTSVALFDVPASDVVAGVTFELVRVGPDLASEWLGLNVGNRNKRTRHVDSLRRDILSGSFLFTGDAIRFDRDGRLIDGQHRLEAVIAAGVVVPLLVVRGLDPRVQSVLDRNARRSAADALRFAGVAVNAGRIAAAARIGLGVDAGYYAHTFDTRKVDATNPEIERWVEDNLDIEEAAAVASKYEARLNVNGSVLSYVTLQLMRIDAEVAVNFLDSMAFMQTDGEGDPRFALMESISQVRRKFQGARSHAYQAIMLSLFFRAWNTWRAGKKVKSFTLFSYSTDEDGRRVPKPISIPEPR